jgi:hypothetical protein
MMLFRLLNPQGIAGTAIAAILALLLATQMASTRHWKAQSARFERRAEQARSALDLTEARVRGVAAEAEVSDRRNADQVRARQAAISKEIDHDFETRLADARTRAQRLRVETAAAAAGRRSATNLPGIPVAAGSPAQAAVQDRLLADDALIATEQAIQLDMLIRWVRRQSAVDPNAGEGSAGKP